MPDRAENNFAIMRPCARVIPLRVVNKKLLPRLDAVMGLAPSKG
jgi:hypothetical protein